MPVRSVPQASWAIIGGSSTNSLKFPQDLNDSRVKNIETGLVYATPYGNSPPFSIFELTGEKVLTCRMHGWRRGVSRADASRQVFWVLKEAGVKRVFGEGGVGALNHLLKPRDLIIPRDYIDLSLRRDVSLDLPFLLVMRDPICPVLHQALVATAEKRPLGRTFDQGIYVVTDGRHFESRAEVAVLRQGPGDVVGQSLCPEVYLAREIGACYAGLYVVVNYAEGVLRDWEHQELARIFYEDAAHLGSLLLDALIEAAGSGTRTCQCGDLRKPTLLQDN
ncbi:MAG: MTAP family purine nucleoside phosphorylase [Syntrophomonadaceae bacterium]|nr:MTAP family purine nucleoside phosphorylase [Syntrophomonadaceae bacterium]